MSIGSNLTQDYILSLSHAVWGMSLKNFSYKVFVSSVFLRNWKETKPLTWRSVSSLLSSQAAPNLTAS